MFKLISLVSVTCLFTGCLCPSEPVTPPDEQSVSNSAVRVTGKGYRADLTPGNGKNLQQ